jgi:hypothetical protein
MLQKLSALTKACHALRWNLLRVEIMHGPNYQEKRNGGIADMKDKAIKWAAIAGAALFCCGLPAVAQQVVSVQFTGGYTGLFAITSGTYAGYDAGAGVYTATINGQSSPGIICDDFNDEITTGETWNANAYQASTLVSSGTLDSTLFGKTIGVQGYAEVAVLVSALFAYPNGVGGITPGELSSAIWDITTPGGITGLDATATAIVNYVEGLFGVGSGSTAAQITAATNYLASLTNLWILTPDPLTGVGSGEPQEMWTSVPEGGAALMYLLLAGLSCFGAMFINARRRTEGLVRA